MLFRVTFWDWGMCLALFIPYSFFLECTYVLHVWLCFYYYQDTKIRRYPMLLFVSYVLISCSYYSCFQKIIQPDIVAIRDGSTFFDQRVSRDGWVFVWPLHVF